ncbi:hypothetical protein [Azospirillum sp. TSH20]|nr:hypothetical protein [Azospirillum sp. TSH20]
MRLLRESPEALPEKWADCWREDVQRNIEGFGAVVREFPRFGVAPMMTKNPFMSAWLSWANRASGMWTSATMSAARRNQAAAQSAMIKAMMTPPKSGQGNSASKPKRKSKPAR